MCKAIELTNNLFNASESIRNEWKELHNRLSIADQKRMDVEHFIELSVNLNASQGYKAYRLLKEVLEERREIKNQIEELRPVFEFANAPFLTDIKKKSDVIKRIKNKHHLNENADELKKYNVRILTDVFGDTITSQVV